MGALKTIAKTIKSTKTLKPNYGKVIQKGNVAPTLGKVKTTGPLFGGDIAETSTNIVKGHKDYLKSLKTGSIEPEIIKIASSLMTDDLRNRINKVGMSQVTLTLLKEEGTDYGDLKELSLVKAAQILGTKLIQSHQEQKEIISGLKGLGEL